MISTEDLTFTDLSVELTMFGRDLAFTLPQTLKVNNATQVGVAITREAVKLSRAAAAAEP